MTIDLLHKLLRTASPQRVAACRVRLAGCLVVDGFVRVAAGAEVIETAVHSGMHSAEEEAVQRHRSNTRVSSPVALVPLIGIQSNSRHPLSQLGKLIASALAQLSSN